MVTVWEEPDTVMSSQSQPTSRHYRKSRKLRKPHPPHLWRNRKDPFEDVSDELRQRVLINPKLKIGKLLKELQQEHPGKYSERHKRTLHRRLKEWRKESITMQAIEPDQPLVSVSIETKTEALPGQKLRKNGQPRKPHPPHTWRTRKDPFEEVCDELKLLVQKNPKVTVGKLFTYLEKEYPGKYSSNLTRTLRRRLKDWKSERESTCLPLVGTLTLTV